MKSLLLISLIVFGSHLTVAAGNKAEAKKADAKKVEAKKMSPSGSAVTTTRNAELLSFEGKKEFDYKITRTVDGTKWSYVTEYKDLEGVVVVTELVKGDGIRFESYSIDRMQTRERGLITSDGKKVKFKYWDKKTPKMRPKKGGEKYNETFAIGGTVVPYLLSKWGLLMKGETIKMDFAIWHRQESITFNYTKEADSKIDGEDVVNVKMHPSNFIYRSLVDPMIWSIRKKDKVLVQIKGRVIPKLKHGTRHSTFDAVLKYKN